MQHGKHLDDRLRRTGRTTRMLEEAATAAAEGAECLVVVATNSQRDHVRRALHGILDRRYPHAHNMAQVGPYKFRIGSWQGGSVRIGSVRIVTADDPSTWIDLKSGYVQGQNVRLFADHFALETFLARVGGWAWRTWLEQNGQALDWGAKS